MFLTFSQVILQWKTRYKTKQLFKKNKKHKKHQLKINVKSSLHDNTHKKCMSGRVGQNIVNKNNPAFCFSIFHLHSLFIYNVYLSLDKSCIHLFKSCIHACMYVCTYITWIRFSSIYWFYPYILYTYTASVRVCVCVLYQGFPNFSIPKPT